ncbi:MAG TPA: hypothetical protein VFE58_13205 [Tepidisphaeraceae bacterium]|jgi:hypothetical protein|nr:hypothetical protein [Tepidisphaeraceae bacterium]
MIRWTITSLLCFLLIGAGPATRQTRLEFAESLWEAKLAATGDKPVVSEYYPTEESLVFLSAYDFTHEPRYAAAAERQLEYAHSREKDGLFLTSSGTTTRDYQARQTYNFYVAYRILGEVKYLRWSDECADALLRVIPRRAHTVNGQMHLLFRGDFYRPDGTMTVENSETIDPNQNSEVALAFSLLFHDVGSRWFDDARAKEIAHEELAAAMSIQDMKTGVLSLTEHIPGGDTAYGSYASFSWTWCQLLWREKEMDEHVRAQGKWLGPLMDLSRDSMRFYPTVIEHGRVPYWEAYYRLPLLWYCGVDGSKLTADLFERMRHPEQTPGDSVVPTAWGYYDLMGMPRAYFLGKSR